VADRTGYRIRELTADSHILVRHYWRPMAVLTVLIWLCGVIVFWPIVTWVLRHLAVHEDTIVGNYSIHLWLLTPRGFLWLLLMGAATLFSSIVYGAGMFLIFNGAGGRTYRDGLRIFMIGMERLLGLFRLSLGLFGLLLPPVLLAGVGPGLAYLLFLGNYDINYYLTHHPPQWYLMLAVGGLWVVGWLIAFVPMVVRLIFVYPSWLAGAPSFRAALRDSWSLSASVRRSLVRLVLLGVAAWGLLAVLFDLFSFWITALLLRLFAESATRAFHILSGYLAIGGMLDSLFFFGATAWTTAVCYLYYHRLKADAAGVGSVVLPPASGRPSRPLPIVLVLTVLALGSWALSQWALQREPAHDPPLVIAHRAGAAHAPENSYSGLKQVLKDGASDLVEIDVQLTSDGEVVVAHDRDFMKAAGDPRVIVETPYSALRKIDIGASFSPDFKRERVTRLEDFLKACDGDLPLIVEFKFAEETHLVARTVKEIQDRKMDEQVILMSLELDDLRQVQELAPWIRTGYFVSMEMGDLSDLDVQVIGLKDGLATPELIEALHERDMVVYSWTIDDPRRMVELMDLGVDGLITNDPLLCQRVVDRYHALTPEQRVLIRFGKFWPVLRSLDFW
jgi:glycerophosphoryl diester phosphodiesterase